MKINGVEKQFAVYGWSYFMDNDSSGHTLEMQLSSETLTPQQDTYAITLKMPYKKVGKNVIESINYFRVADMTSYEGNFTQAELQSKVTVSKNTCISATFSGSATINGNVVTITDGVIKHVY